MATAHIIYGYLGAGKTTFARKLERELPSMRFSNDECVSALFGDNPPVETFWQHVNAVNRALMPYWQRALILGVDVVLDDGFWTRKRRDELRATITSLGANYQLYRLECSEEEAWKRIEIRNANLKGSLFISRNTFETLKKRFEPLGPDELYKEIAGLKPDGY